jgi:lipoate-protein ligase A
MDRDLKLFHDLERGLVPSTLRIYSWEPNCISLGYSQRAEKEIDFDKASALGWDVVKRPTGGGIVFHNEAEVTYSLVTAIDNPLLPKGLVPSFKKISEAIVLALHSIGISSEIRNSKLDIRNSKSQLCFSYPAEYEIVVEAKKIVGSAQKRGRKALLQQGSISVRKTPDQVLSVLKRKYDEIDAISVEELLGRVPSFTELSQALIDGLREGLGFEI